MEGYARRILLMFKRFPKPIAVSFDDAHQLSIEMVNVL